MPLFLLQNQERGVANIVTLWSDSVKWDVDADDKL